MTASFTCHRLFPPSGTGSDHYSSQVGSIGNHNSSSHFRHCISPSTTLASTPLCSNPVLDTSSFSPSSSWAVPPISPLEATAKVANCHSTFDLTMVASAGILPTIPDSINMPSSMEASARHSTTPTPLSPPSSPQALRTPKRKRTVSPPSPSSKTFEEVRSSSRSIRRSGPSSRTVTTVSITPSMPGSPNRRESLLALHRESCRLFQDHDMGLVTLSSRRSSSPPSPHSPNSPPRPLRTSSNISSPPVSPILKNRPSISSREIGSAAGSYKEAEAYAHRIDSVSTIQPTPTVIDWTSPSTRRREYEEIDRASSGVRGFWRRVAPRWCQFGDRRMPFFEEGKNGKGNYEGSVRRFRMDIPDDAPEGQTCMTSRRGLSLKKKLVVHGLGSRRKPDLVL